MELSAEMAVDFLFLRNVNLNALHLFGTNGSNNIVMAHIDEVVAVNRYLIHLKVVDHSSSAVFILKDSVALGFYEKHLIDETGSFCMAHVRKKSYLFKVCCPNTQSSDYDNTYVVKNICMEKDIIDQFQYKMNTEEYLFYQASFTTDIMSKLASAESYSFFDEQTPSFKKRVFAPAQF